MIFLFTDFGRGGPYLGQMIAVLARQAPGQTVIDLFNDGPPFDAQGAAYLLPAFTADIAAGDVVLGVVDPGVGTDRDAVVLLADERWFVGPDNGLFAMVARRAARAEAWSSGWRPERLSRTFHGRDLFAPVAAGLALKGRNARDDLGLHSIAGLDRPTWPDEHKAIAYFDRYGNAITGWRAAGLSQALRLRAGSHTFGYAATFAAAALGSPFWYENSSGLVELALDRGNAQKELHLAVGMPVTVA